ncbi:MAG: hypothetical protein MHM6MM_004914 [Cercozoa sp. M6MM]
MSNALLIPAMCVLIGMSGMFSGLTLGLLGLDLKGLEIVQNGDDPKLATFARKIMTVRRHGNWLLCTLLLGNVCVNAALTLIVDQLFKSLSAVVGLIVSTALITTFGEIIPQAVCARHALAIGARVVWPVRFLMLLMSPIAWPASWLLDKLLGEELGTIYSNEELRHLIEMHADDIEAQLQPEVAGTMKGALDFGKKQVRDVMTPWDKVFTLPQSARLDFSVLTDIFKSGHSRIPCVDEHGNVVGLLHVKDLVLLDPEDETPVSTLLQLYGRSVQKVFPDEKLDGVMRQFRSGKSHLAVVHDVSNEGPGDPFYFLVGIVTLEDLVEAILNYEIVDEFDNFVDMRDPTHTAINRESRIDNALSLFDYRRRLPHANITPQEAQAVFFHLSGTVDLFLPENRAVDVDAFKHMIARARVIEVSVDETDKNAAQRAKQPLEDNGWLLYERGRPTEYFSLLLDGRVRIQAGREGFESEVARWSSLCADCLETVPKEGINRLDELPAFAPDYTATLVRNARVLRISRQDYARAIKETRHAKALLEQDPLRIEGSAVATTRRIRSASRAAARSKARAPSMELTELSNSRAKQPSKEEDLDTKEELEAKFEDDCRGEDAGDDDTAGVGVDAEEAEVLNSDNDSKKDTQAETDTVATDEPLLKNNPISGSSD